MEFFVNYLLESSVILGVLTVFYRLVLHHEPLFKFNRVYLLVSLLLAAVVPFIQISIHQAFSVNDQGFANMLQTVNVFAGEVRQTVVPVIAEYNVFKWLYLTGAMGLFIRLAIGIIRLGGLSRKAVWQTKNGFKIADLPGHFNPFSFFHVIFINRTLYSNNDLEKIMVHEMAHVRFKHSMDVFIMEMLLIVQWFNPFAWLIRRLLKELHEFQADRSVIDDGVSVGLYKELLLFQATGARLLPVNNFNQSITKKRFKMMTNHKLKHSSFIKTIAAILLVVGVGFFFACDNEDINETLVPDFKSSDTEMEKPVFYIVEVMPNFPGGDVELRKFIAKNVIYPTEAVEKGIQGRVYVNFVVDDTGKVIHVGIARGVHELIDEEAIRVVSSMPDWTPGMQRGKYVNVEYTVPINFVLDNNTKEEGHDTLVTKNDIEEESVVNDY